MAGLDGAQLGGARPFRRSAPGSGRADWPGRLLPPPPLATGAALLRLDAGPGGGDALGLGVGALWPNDAGSLAGLRLRLSGRDDGALVPGPEHRRVAGVARLPTPVSARPPGPLLRASDPLLHRLRLLRAALLRRGDLEPQRGPPLPLALVLPLANPHGVALLPLWPGRSLPQVGVLPAAGRGVGPARGRLLARVARALAQPHHTLPGDLPIAEHLRLVVGRFTLYLVAAARGGPVRAAGSSSGVRCYPFRSTSLPSFCPSCP